MQGWAVCNSFRTFGLTHDRASSACSSPIRRNISSSCNTNPRNLQNSSDMSLGFFRKISPRREGMMMRDAHLCNRCRTLAAAHIYHAPVHARTHAEQKRVDLFPGTPGVEPGAGVPHAPPFMVCSMSVFAASARRQCFRSLPQYL